MRSEQTIEHEIDVARTDLEASISELKATVKDAIDIKKRARRAVDRIAAQLADLAQRAERSLREHKAIAIGVAAGVVGVTAIALVAYNRRA